MLEIGQPAPDFELLNQDRKPVRLSDFRGKKVILFAFPRADTPGCTTQACGFRDNLPRFETKNAVVLGISDDSPEDLAKWREKQNFTYDFLSDPDHKVLEQYGAWGEKVSFGKKSVGTLRSHWVIDENGILIDQRIKISPTDSYEEALKLIEA
ncbi:MAG: peroxiredoxin [Chloroflexota bacterium]|nr:MAG: peroxiredoxin [Chloroflexota bacterium]